LTDGHPPFTLDHFKHIRTSHLLAHLRKYAWWNEH